MLLTQWETMRHWRRTSWRRPRLRLAHYKCPTSIDFVEALPRNPSGKVLKRELRAPYWEDRDRNIG